MRRRHLLIRLSAVGVGIGAILLALRPAPLYRATIFSDPVRRWINPRSLNDRGQVVGVTRIGSSNSQQMGSSDWHLFFWDRAGGLQDLGPASAWGCAINNRGQIAATVMDMKGNEQAVLRDPNGAVQLLGTLGGDKSVAAALNERGQVAGRSVTARDGNGNTAIHAFLWDQAGGMRDLGALDGTNSVAQAVTDAGQVFGFYQSRRDAGEPREPCYWNPADAASAAGVRLPGESYTAMNNKGCVVGRHFFLKDRPHIVLWRDYTGMEKLFPYDPDDDVFGRTLFVNDANQVVCSEVHHSRWERYSLRLFPVRTRHFLWDPQRGRVALDRYVPRGFGDFEVRDLNNHGCILGVLYTKDGGSSAIILEPIPERWKK